jgi:hypothetical protein
MISNRFSRVGGANWELNYLHDPFDRNGFSPYNTMNQHSRQLRSSLNSLHSERSNQFGARYGSKINTTTYELIRDSEPTDQDPHGSRDTRPAVAASIHMTNRNTRHRPDWDHAEYYSSTGWSTNKPLKQEYDNFFVQHQIPQSDLQYRWITASTNLNSSSFFGFEVPYTPNQSRQNSITFPTTAPFGIAVNRAYADTVFLETGNSLSEEIPWIILGAQGDSVENNRAKYNESSTSYPLSSSISSTNLFTYSPISIRGLNYVILQAENEITNSTPDTETSYTKKDHLNQFANIDRNSTLKPYFNPHDNFKMQVKSVLMSNTVPAFTSSISYYDATPYTIVERNLDTTNEGHFLDKDVREANSDPWPMNSGYYDKLYTHLNS